MTASIRDGVIYQIYPPSFADGNGDGVGDLGGLIDRLPYLSSLGVDALWLNPVYPSGGVDGGYDVSDYRAIDPLYGTLDDFDRFLAAAHDRGLRVILDFVPHHTSDRHPWFTEARSSRESPQRDWYVFRDGRDGGPPNNWLSGFRDGGPGPAWIWDDSTGQYYRATFYPGQPDIDWENPEVRRAIGESMRFWVDRGVDGFRIDVIHLLSRDPQMRDNPPGDGWAGQLHRYDENGPRAHEYVRSIREAVGAETELLGEAWIFDLEEVAKYLAPGELDLAFNFPFAYTPWNAKAMGDLIDLSERIFQDDVWPCYHLSNHDTPRHSKRFGEQAIRPAAVLLLTLRGTPVLFQGEEIGMVEGEVPPERRRDRLGRDPCRTPMQWDASANAGFCRDGVEPWLPVVPGYEHRNVAVESDEPDSVLALYRRMLALRRRSPALRRGTYQRIEAPEGCLAYLRESDGERLLVAVNFTSSEVVVESGDGEIELATSLAREGERVGDRLRLEADQALVVRLAGALR